MSRMRIVVNVVGAIAVTTAVLVAHGVPDRSPDAASPVSWPILTVGDRVHGYRLMHSPDAIAAFDNGDGTFTLLARHASSASRWVISADDFTLLDAMGETSPESGRFATDVDASTFLGDGWRLRIEAGRVVARTTGLRAPGSGLRRDFLANAVASAADVPLY